MENPPRIVLVDIEKSVGKAPVQTSFHLPSHVGRNEWLYILLEQGSHEPSPAEYLAPFHRDPTQRIAAVKVSPFDYLVFRLEELLKLVEGHEGHDIPWDEWNDHVFPPSFSQRTLTPPRVWISGSRLFSVTSTMEYGPDAQMEVYDFSIQGHAKYLRANAGAEGLKCLLPTGAVARVPWTFDEIVDADGCHDSIMFFGVSALPFFGLRLGYMIHDVAQFPRGSGARGGVLHIWTF